MSDVEMDATVTFEEILEMIHLVSSKKLWLSNPKFWRIFPAKMEEQPLEEPVIEELEELKVQLKKVENIFQMNNETLSRLSLKEALPRLKSLLGPGFRMLYSVELMKELKKWLRELEEDLIRTEDLSLSSQPTTTTSTSSMIVRTPDSPVVVSGEKKPKKRKMLTLEEDLESDEDEEYQNSVYPTGNVSTYTSVLKDGDKRHHRS